MFLLYRRLCSTTLTRLGIGNGKFDCFISPWDTALLHGFDSIGFICESHEPKAFALNAVVGFLGDYKGVLDRGDGREEGREFSRSGCRGKIANDDSRRGAVLCPWLPLLLCLWCWCRHTF